MNLNASHYMQEINKPCPCDDCRHYYDCKHQLLACRQFFTFVHSGRFMSGPRAPTRKIWLRLYAEDHDTPMETKELKQTVKEMK